MYQPQYMYFLHGLCMPLLLCVSEILCMLIYLIMVTTCILVYGNITAMHWFPSQSSSMLIIAIEYNNEQVVAELLKKGVDPNRPSMKVKQQSADINL